MEECKTMDLGEVQVMYGKPRELETLIGKKLHLVMVLMLFLILMILDMDML